jgi:hypothetical protein
MLQELVARTGATAWAIASMIFFIGFWLFIAVRVFCARPDDLEARAHLALEGDPPSREAPRRASPVSREALGAADSQAGPDRHER